MGKSSRMKTTIDKTALRRVEMILREIDALPTLPAIATKLLSLTTSTTSEMSHVVDLIRSDQALTAKLLRMTQRADVGAGHVTSVDQAVKLLGFSAVRNAVLSLKIIEVFDAAGDGVLEKPGLKRVQYWRHSLAVAVAAEELALSQPGLKIDPGQAFVCGLLHDIGKLALDYVLPKSYAAVVKHTDQTQNDIAQVEQKIIGLNHHLVGKRLAEMWNLPHEIKEVIWFHNANNLAVPQNSSYPLIALVTVADQLIRESHIGYSGNYQFDPEINKWAQAINLFPITIKKIKSQIHQKLEQKLHDLGIEEVPCQELYLNSIAKANQSLGKTNQKLQRRADDCLVSQKLITQMDQFARLATPQQGIQTVLEQVIDSLKQQIDQQYVAVLLAVQEDPAGPPEWLIAQWDPQYKRILGPIILDSCLHQASILDSNHHFDTPIDVSSQWPWIASYLETTQDISHLQAQWLVSQGPVKALVLYCSEQQKIIQQLKPLMALHGKMLTIASALSQSRSLSEELANANLIISQTQEALLESKAMSKLGQLTAGAAHEMNNPLMVISGRAQQLSTKLKVGSEEQKSAQILVQQAKRLSDLITSLHLLSQPPIPNLQQTDIKTLIEKTVRKARESLPVDLAKTPITISIRNKIAYVTIDPQMIAEALYQVLRNALQSSPKSGVQITIQNNPDNPALFDCIMTDDGQGMDQHTLAHAMDPFFSAQKAGRRVGMGLPSAQAIINVHNGTIRLASTHGSGTAVTLSIALY